MADFVIRNPLNVSQAFTVSVTMRQVKITTDDPRQEGDLQWILEAATLARNCDGDLVPAKWTYLRSFNTVDEEMNYLVNEISKEICWDEAVDTTAPAVSEQTPESNATDVPLNITLSFQLTDYLEKEYIASGIKKESIKFFLKGFDLTDRITIEGNPWDYNFSFTPGTKEPDYGS